MAIQVVCFTTIVFLSWFPLVGNLNVLALDISSQPWTEVHVEYCGMMCDNDTVVHLRPSYECVSPECFQCDCDPSCSILGSCCPQGLVLPDGSPKVLEVKPVQPPTFPPFPEQVQCGSIPYSSKTYLQVASCPAGNTGDHVDSFTVQPTRLVNLSDLCPKNDDDVDLDSILPYVGVTDGIVFKNKFCALCNGYSVNNKEAVVHSRNVAPGLNKSNALPWSLKLNCQHYQNMYTLTSLKALVDAATIDITCSVIYKEPPSKVQPRPCFPNPPENYDAYLCMEPTLSLCHQLNHTYLTVFGHKNIFCYMCKGLEPQLKHCSDTQTRANDFAGRGKKLTHIPPITLLLGMHRFKTSSGHLGRDNCTLTIQWLDEQGECQPALCSAGKLPEDSGECVSAIEQIRGLGYRLFLVLLPENATRVSPDDVQRIAEKIASRISEISIESKVQTNISVRFDESLEVSHLEKIVISAYFVGNVSESRDDYEARLLEAVFNEWSLEMFNEAQERLILKPTMMGHELKDVQQIDHENVYMVKGLTSLNNENDEYYTPNNVDKYDDKFQRFPSLITLATIPPFVRSSTKPTGIHSPIKVTDGWKFLSKHRYNTTSSTKDDLNSLKPTGFTILLTQWFSTYIDRTALWSLQDKFIDVTHSLACPYVSVNITNTTSSGQFIMFSFLFKGEAVSVKSDKQVSLMDGKLQVCTELYRRLTHHILMRTRQSVVERIQYYTELVCVSLSVTCLLLSAITYCVFPSLRSLPGLNNLSLCVSLAVAQTCLLITARWGVEERLPREYCLAHAVLLHYSWLAAAAWMSVCCIHMYRVFTTHDNTFSDTRDDRKRYLHYCVYGFGLPALIVVATYAVNSVLTSGGSNGYDSHICFLDTSRSVWTLALSLLVPLCLVILTNGVLFVLTIKQIIVVSNMQEYRRSRDRQGVLTYVKLSTLTGLLGAVVVVAVQLDIAVLSLLTSPLMALQGVFIFASFTWNVRVRKLYLELFRRLGLPCASKKEKTSSTASSAVRGSSNSSKAQTASTKI